MVKLRTIFKVVLVVSTLFIAWKGYSYFFDITNPEMQLTGLEPNQVYAGHIPCSIDVTKQGVVSVLVDEKVIVPNQKVSVGKKVFSFEVPTENITDGKHRFKVELIDSSYNKNSTVIERDFFVDNIPLEVSVVKKDDLKVLQGRTLHVQFKTNKEIKDAKVEALANSYSCCPEGKKSLLYECFIPIQCEESPNEYLLTLNASDVVGNVIKEQASFKVVAFPFKKSTVTISDEKLQEEEKVGLNTKKFGKEIEKITGQSPNQKLWKGAFCTPIDIQRVTTEFGTVRTTQHKGRYAHKALDIINQPKSVVWAPQDGVVVMKERFIESGNTVIIDHGCGILSMLFHLDSFASINVGDKIAKGNPIGTLGKTGYASGYHLHWEMRVNNIPVDPMQWTKPVF